MTKKSMWFEEWFDSPFYHILYGHRDEVEAHKFIHKLVHFLNPKPESFFLDLACGKGRHALVMHEMGFKVHGMDLSANSIAHAKEFEEIGLSFSEGDMRNCYFPNTFNYVFNLFTSFGYFNEAIHHHATLTAIHKQLKSGGILVLDYVNVQMAENEIGNGLHNTVVNHGIAFNTHKYLSKNQINKSIEFVVNDYEYHFKEHIWRLRLHDFDKLLKESGFEIQTIFGDYELEVFDPNVSSRLIIVAQKL